MVETERFDREAATWDENPRRVRLAREVAEAMRREACLAPTMDLLDFGCGTGLLTLSLLPSVRSVTGADTSRGMLEVLERKVREQGAAVRTFQLRAEDGHALEGTYDAIVSSMVLHHVQDPAALFRRFRGHLRPGGQVALADLDTEDGTFHEKNPGDVFHLGFERAQVKAWLTQAGFLDLKDTTAHVVRRNGRDYPVFLVTGRLAG